VPDEGCEQNSEEVTEIPYVRMHIYIYMYPATMLLQRI